MIEKVNKEFRKLKTFTQFKIIKLGSISKIIDKKAKIFNKLFKDLNKMTNPLETIVNLDLHKNKEKMKKTEIFINKEKQKITKINKKLKLKNDKPIKYNLSFNMKRSASITTTNNNSNKFSFITSPLYTNKNQYYNINPINTKTAGITINDNNKEKYLFDKKLNHVKKINYETNQSKVNQYNSLNNYRNEESFLKTFITQQKTDSILKRNNSLLNKTTLNISNNRNTKTQQSFHKQLSKKILSDYINNSTNLFNNQYIKFLEDEETINSTIKNIKNMLKENEKYKSYEKRINALINEDIDIPKIRKSMKIFKQSLKEKISFKTNDLFKTSLISKKIADIINCWDTFSKMNDTYFYQNKNAFYKIYPPLSLKATKDPLDNNYAQIYYFLAQKNKIKKNKYKIRRLSV